MKKLYISLGSIIAIAAIGTTGYFTYKNQQQLQPAQPTSKLHSTARPVAAQHTAKPAAVLATHNTKTIKPTVASKENTKLSNKVAQSAYKKQLQLAVQQNLDIANASVGRVFAKIQAAYHPANTKVIKQTPKPKTQVAKHALTPAKQTIQAQAETPAAGFQVAGVNSHALKLGLNAYNKLKKEGKVHGPYLTVVDFTKPSTDPYRLSVINVDTHKLVMHGLVAHGKGSGGLKATRFSNHFGTEASSLGAYVTTGPFYGKHGLSLHISGVEKGVNNNAAARTIEIHPAPYVSESFIKQTGRLGRSWGCFAVNPAFSKTLVNTIKNGNVIFAYASQEDSDPFVHMA